MPGALTLLLWTNPDTDPSWITASLRPLGRELRLHREKTWDALRQAVSKVSPDLILIDLAHAAPANGNLQHALEEGARGGVPVIVLGADPDDLPVPEHLRSGATSVVAVSDSQQLLAAVQGVLRPRPAPATPPACSRVQADQTTHLAVTRLLAQALPLAQSAPELLRLVGEALGCEAGEFRRRDPASDQLSWAGGWHAPTWPHGAEFQRLSQEQSFLVPDGLPGRVCATGQPVWLTPGPEEIGTERAALLAQEQWQGAYAFPISMQAQVAGVLCFYGRSLTPPDQATTRLLEEICGQIGQVLERERAEERLARLNGFFLSFSSDCAQNIQRLVTLAGEMLGAAGAAYKRWERGQFQVAACWNLPQDFLLCEEGDGMRCFEAIRSRPPHSLVQHRYRPEGCSLKHPEKVRHHFQTCFGQTVRVGEHAAGVVSVFFRKEHEPAEADRRLLGLLAAAIGMEEERLKSQHERQIMEEQLRRSQKLESIGQLAAGIAHEINTPTQFVGDNMRFVQDAFQQFQQAVGACRQVLEAALGGSLTPEMIEQAEATFQAADLDYLLREFPTAVRESLEGIDRITRIARAMKEFSYPSSKDRVPVRLNHAIESTVTVARNEWKYVAEIVLDLDPNLPPVPCFACEINQTVLNLVVNAAHAIADAIKAQPGPKGTITVRTRRLAEWAEIQVADTGTGIPEAIRDRIYEPFFTTKDVGKGTGQGLTIVHNTVVNRHGGTIHFETELGRGTTFFVRLPLLRPCLDPATPNPTLA